ncbi:N-acetylglucosamine kinase [Acetatifactor aquisgranensis]|uniref:N-acetylglucosamine kinase n=1 Tax=Acetatifactor aquisgranensis TaxID=2941233 RepID=UPI00203C1E0E|nr:BadF/BadG/BcrA/BcrD ATPase family protein [Acetatifactor aquisgranensis]
MMNYYIGMDAGGTGTSVLVSDGRKDLFQTKTEGLNCNSFPRERIVRSLRNAMADLASNGFSPADCLGIGIGAAGNNNPAAAELLRDCLANCGFHCQVTICSDADAALYGAFEEEDGLLLISGTGSICLGQTDAGRKRYRAGGFGHLIDDEGSAYAIGRDIAAAVVRAEDGRGPETVLRDILFSHLGISDSSELVAYVYDMSHTKKEIAQLARLISLPETDTDQAVRQIIAKAAAALLEMAAAVCRQMESRCGEAEIPLVLHGSVLRNNQRIAGELTKALAAGLPRIRLTEARTDASHGAVWLARRNERG